jgi:hypothetical protein
MLDLSRKAILHAIAIAPLLAIGVLSVLPAPRSGGLAGMTLLASGDAAPVGWDLPCFHEG